jgi:hypothetical protein
MGPSTVAAAAILQTAAPASGNTYTTDTVEPPSKKAKHRQLVIGTHNGTFHCDEALAIFLLKRTSRYKYACQ